MNIYGLNEPRRPAEGINNVWYADRDKDHVIVFVHGILSDSYGCWYQGPASSQPGVYWPDLLTKDPRFDDFSIFLGGYFTGVESGIYEVHNCAEELMDALNEPDKTTQRVVLRHKTVIFVCHSMGGIVVRYMLTARPWAFKDVRVGLVLVASPSHGARFANYLDLLIQYFKNEQGKILKWGSTSLEDLNHRFRIIVNDPRAIPHLFGAEACESQFIIGRKWFLPPAKPLVTPEEAGSFFGTTRMLPQTDHFSCVKPDSSDHPGYKFLAKFCHDLVEKKAIPIKRKTPAASSRASGTKVVSGGTVFLPLLAPGADRLPACRCCHWDVKIDEEGDAYNETTYEGIVIESGQPAVFPLAPAEVQSGNMARFDLVKDGRTSEDAILEITEEAPMKAVMSVKFTNHPTTTRPGGFCISSYDWNVFSMNMEEFRQKQGWRDDGMDFAEKLVPGDWKELNVTIRFPDQLAFAKTPFFEVYEPSLTFDPPVPRNETLTRRYQRYFRYSPALNHATLSIPNPASPFSYRIAWLVGESKTPPSSPPLPLQRTRQRAFARKLLAMRETLDGGPSDLQEAQNLGEITNSALASVAEFIQTLLGVSEKLDPNFLDISLLVLDEDQPMPAAGNNEKKPPVLRHVAGMRLRSPQSRDFRLFVGDGNAGRAWKRRMARVFDHTDKDPKRHIYVSIPGTVDHRFLVSVPLLGKDSEALIFGILNVGTYSDEQAEVLRPLGSRERGHIQHLTSYAQVFVLQKLLDALRI